MRALVRRVGRRRVDEIKHRDEWHRPVKEDELVEAAVVVARMPSVAGLTTEFAKPRFAEDATQPRGGAVEKIEHDSFGILGDDVGFGDQHRTRLGKRHFTEGEFDVDKCCDRALEATACG